MILSATVLTVCAFLLVFIIVRDARLGMYQEKSTGLGAVAIEFDAVSMWNQSPMSSLFGIVGSAPSVGLTPRTFNTEEYGVISESRFTQVSTSPLSTFSIDVDTASYGNVRRFLKDGTLPPSDAVRIEGEGPNRS